MIVSFCFGKFSTRFFIHIVVRCNHAPFYKSAYRSVIKAAAKEAVAIAIPVSSFECQVVNADANAIDRHQKVNIEAMCSFRSSLKYAGYHHAGPSPDCVLLY